MKSQMHFYYFTASWFRIRHQSVILAARSPNLALGAAVQTNRISSGRLGGFLVIFGGVPFVFPCLEELCCFFNWIFQVCLRRVTFFSVSECLAFLEIEAGWKDQLWLLQDVHGEGDLCESSGYHWRTIFTLWLCTLLFFFLLQFCFSVVASVSSLCHPSRCVCMSHWTSDKVYGNQMHEMEGGRWCWVFQLCS